MKKIIFQQTPVKIYRFECIESTNTWAKTNIEKWLKKGVTIISASCQTQGRGQLQKKWISPKNTNIYLSFCFFYPSHLLVSQFAQVCALSLVHTLRLKSIDAKIKWPNDIIASGKKIAGILCEVNHRLDQQAVICGIGLNVNMREEQLSNIDQPAHSMYSVTKGLFCLQEVENLLTETCMKNWKTFIENGFEPFFEEFEDHLVYKIGDDLLLKDEKNYPVKGKFFGIHQDGALKLLIAEKIKLIYSCRGLDLF